MRPPGFRLAQVWYTACQSMLRVVFTLALAASGLLAQAPTPGRLVRLYPVAFDANGQPVTDLTADDFKIVDQTKAGNDPRFPQAQERAGPAAARCSGILQPDVRGTPHTTVILFDMINWSDADRQENWKALDKAIPQLESGENLYFYVLNLEGVLVPVHPIGPPAADDKTWPQGMWLRVR